MDVKTVLEFDGLQEAIEDVYKRWKDSLILEGSWQPVLPQKPEITEHNTDVFFRDVELDQIPQEIFSKFAQVRVKKSRYDVNLVELGQLDTQQLRTTFDSWKKLLEEYLQKKYGDRAEAYIAQLRELNIL